MKSVGVLSAMFFVYAVLGLLIDDWFPLTLAVLTGVTTMIVMRLENRDA